MCRGRDVLVHWMWRRFLSFVTFGGHRQELLLQADPLCIYDILCTYASDIHDLLLLITCNVCLYVHVIYIVGTKILGQNGISHLCGCVILR